MALSTNAIEPSVMCCINTGAVIMGQHRQSGRPFEVRIYEHLDKVGFFFLPFLFLPLHSFKDIC